MADADENGSGHGMSSSDGVNSEQDALKRLADIVSNQAVGWEPALAKQKFSPLELVLMMKADLGTVKVVYRLNPDALVPRLLQCVRVHGGSPGVLEFLQSPTTTEGEENPWYVVDNDGSGWTRFLRRCSAWRVKDGSSEGDDDSMEDDDIITLHPIRHKVSALEIALMMKGKVDIIQKIYDSYPAALTKELLFNACQFGGKPGVIGLLARMLPTAVSEKDGGNSPLFLAMKSGPGEGRPTEEDIMELIKVYPEAAEDVGRSGIAPLILGLMFQYSPKLLSMLFQSARIEILHLPSHIFGRLSVIESQENRRTCMDLDCVGSMTQIFGRIEFLHISCKNWSVDAFVECLRQVIHGDSSSIRQLKIDCPLSLFHDNGSDVQDLVSTPTWQALIQEAGNSNLMGLALKFGRGAKEKALLPALLGTDFVHRLPKLQKCSLRAAELWEEISPFLCHLLRTTKSLVTLEVFIRLNMKEDTTPFWNALAVNQTVRTIRFRGDFLRAHEAKLLDILKEKNTTLQHMTLPRSPFRESFEYYLKFNEYGRGKVTNKSGNLGLAEFVTLLDAAISSYRTFAGLDSESDSDSDSDSDDKRRRYEGVVRMSGVIFGLLRECPVLWSCRKQKRNRSTPKSRKKKKSM